MLDKVPVLKGKPLTQVFLWMVFLITDAVIATKLAGWWALPVLVAGLSLAASKDLWREFHAAE